MESNENLDHSVVDYDNSPKGSVWGAEDRVTHNALDRMSLEGSWINLGAGDGRYTDRLLSSCSKLTALDNDPRALAKLDRETPAEYQSVLSTVVGDLTGTLAFESNSFDGAFCTATIHCFAEDVIPRILQEAVRIVKPQGVFLFDFLTDIRRMMGNGGVFVYPGETSYSKQRAQQLVRDAIGQHQLEFSDEYRVKEEITDNGTVPYRWTGTVLLCKCTVGN